MTTIEQISNVLVNLILAGVLFRVVFSAFKIIVEQEGEWKQIRNLIIVAILTITVFTLKETILYYYQ